MPIFSYCLLPLIILANNGKMRSYIYREFRSRFAQPETPGFP
jgi:hypothetical protein